MITWGGNRRDMARGRGGAINRTLTAVQRTATPRTTLTAFVLCGLLSRLFCFPLTLEMQGQTTGYLLLASIESGREGYLSVALWSVSL